MITARMVVDKYIELAPGFPYEVVKYEDGKIKLKNIPRIYPVSDFKIQKNGKGEALNGEETEKGMWMERIRDFLEVLGISILFITAGVAAFIIFFVLYYSCELLYVPWFNEAFSPWLVEQIKIIFSHPENFCGFLFILSVFIMVVGSVVLLIGAFVGWVKKTLVR